MTNGWTGNLLRIDLSSGKITKEDSSKYKQFIGGMGFGYKIMYDEVAPGTQPFDEANKIVFAVGPLTGSGAPCSSRVNITTLSTFTRGNLVVDAHMGGFFAAYMKYAGYDAIIIEGKSPKPVWINIQDDKVTLENAAFLWGKGTRETTAEICRATSEETCVAAIGPAGENRVPLSGILNSRNHSGGAGSGAVLGAKNLKAIAVRGNKGVNVADRQELKALNDYMMTQLIGANNNHVVPSTPQAWAEYSSPQSRWTARKGLYWKAAEGGPIETGEIPPGNQNTVGFRTMKSTFDLGPEAEQYTVKMGGCHSCPIRCMSQLNVPQAKQFGVPSTGGNTCVANFVHTTIFPKGPKDIQEKGDGNVVGNLVGLNTFDDMGLWCNYGQLHRDFTYCYTHGVFKRVLPADEYSAIPWNWLEEGDPRFITDFYHRLAHRIGELSHLADGSYILAQRWELGDEYWNYAKNKLWSPMGFPVHHANEASAQVGSIVNCMFNRDAMTHTHINYIGSGLPLALQKEIAGELFGSPDAYDETKNYTPINPYKIKYAQWAIFRSCLHDAITLCNWVWPMTVSPHKSRRYRGDLAMEAKFFAAVTGEPTTPEDLDVAAERIFTLHRAYTVKLMNTKDMRREHDQICDWVFDKDPKIKVFTEGTDKMDREDMHQSLTMFYTAMGWDPDLGCPTRATLLRLNMADVAEDLASRGLLPS
ncbi:aldehyde ferredoxin oxidoreductase [Musicola paradisiaca]|uniref:Aldehyde ferredoxin oxidoreductase n=1 Tax=Musicola paradisiaca (strain Ech703) TaxID=579405 RepID=C6C7I5_MUSP7|nr:aldehyde ferredoxin oxidoreductase [Musicola paradisiaca]ACS84103.1 Aldehyde ferredoxin oxidoreductase [Musicola paradisiaca Ech703]